MSAIDQAIAKLDSILANLSDAKPAAQLPLSESQQSVGSSDALACRSVAPAPAAAPAAPAAAAEAAPAPAGKAEDGAREVLTTKAQIKVARIISAEPLANSAKLLKMKAYLGNDDTRQIMAGLAQYIKPEQLIQRLVCVVANLKPAKLAGEASEAMVLAAEAPGADGQLNVYTLLPPEGSQPGDVIHLDGAMPPETYPKVLKLDVWRKVVPGLTVQGGKATFEGTPLVSSQGLVTVPAEVPDGAEIH